MATVANNDLMDGLSGRLGASLVFRTMRGKTFVATPARKPDKRKESTAQRGTRVTFREASQWAQNILLNPEQKAYYQQRAKKLKLPNAYTAALTDYMRKPQLKEMTRYADVTTYGVSKKDFHVKQIDIVIDDTHEGSKERRTLVIAPGKRCVFKLTDAERQTGVSVYVMDATERVILWKIGDLPEAVFA